MVKHFCDRCGKETDNLNRIHIPQKRISCGDYESRIIDVCRDCEIEHASIIGKLMDIRFILFADFMKDGADNG